MADMKISDLPAAPNVNDAQQFEVNDSGNSRRVTFQMLRAKLQSLFDSAYATKSHTHTAAQISDASATGKALMTATSANVARASIGAGTSNLTLGTTAGTAKPGDWLPPMSSLTGAITTAQLPAYTAGENFVVASYGSPSLSIGNSTSWHLCTSFRAKATGTIRVKFKPHSTVYNYTAISVGGTTVFEWYGNKTSGAQATVDVSVIYGGSIDFHVRRQSGSAAAADITLQNLTFFSATPTLF